MRTVIISARFFVLAAVTYASLVQASQTETEQRKEEGQVLHALLTHFGKQGKDALFYSKGGKILVDAKQIAAPEDHGSAFARDGKCKPSAKLVLAMSKSKHKPTNWGDTFPSSPEWEVMNPGDAEKRNFMELPKDSKGDTAKTIVSLMQPVLSADGSEAFVAFDFIWSIHGAHAWYVLARDKKAWRVRCFEMVHFV